MGMTIPAEPKIKYTKEDLESLKNFLSGGSPVHLILDLVGYDPDQFCLYMQKLKKEWSFIFDTPLNDLPLTMSDTRFEGWRRWRFSIGK